MLDKNSELQMKAEKIVKKNHAPFPDSVDGMSVVEIEQMYHKLQVHQIELEMQNDELRRTQVELDNLRERYFDLYNTAPIGYLTINDEGIIIESNLTASNLICVSPGKLVNKNISGYVFRDDQDLFYLRSKKIFATGNPDSCELRIEKTDKTVFWAHLDATVVKNENGGSLCRITMSDISTSKNSEMKIEKLLAEKEIILKEVHHRIKNNMNIVKGLLTLQSSASENPIVADGLRDAENRVTNMMVLYDKLYCSDDFGNLSIKDYFNSLISEIVSNFTNCSIVKINKEIEDFILDVKTLSSLGMIVNEIITNIMKYAFIAEMNGTITISVSKQDNHVTMSIGDNGSGLAESENFTSSTGFGLQLIGMLTEQISGNIRIERVEGTTFIIEFNIRQDVESGDCI